MRSSEYWKGRFEQLERSQHQKGMECYAEIEKQYRQAQRQIESQIAVWYQRFADNNGVTMQEARRMLNKQELEELKWDVQEYIRYGKENALNQQWMKQLENASARYHIGRLEALKLQTQQSLEVLFGNQLDGIDSTMRDVYKAGYYKTAFEIQKGVGVGWDFATLDEKGISKVINKPWAVDGKNFSERVWGNRQKLVNELHTELTRNVMLGRDPQKAIDAIARKMNTSKNVAGRLVMTEEAFFSSAAQKDCFNELDVELFEIVATLDSHTSEICREMDGKVFPMSQWEVGVTAPPFHVWCRTTTVPAFGDEFDSIGERAARGEDGKTYYVPANMTYKEWQKSFVEGDKTGLQEVESDDTMKEINDETLKLMVEKLDGMSVEYKQVMMNQKQLTEKEIIDVLSGGDKTNGSCVSVGLAYIGQKGGMNVLDFRGGGSQSFFSKYVNLKEITKFPNVNAIFETAKSTITVGNKLLKRVEQGKEYYLTVGRHATIVRRTDDGILQYLELQSPTMSGWIDFNGNPRFTLASRFGCASGMGYTEEGFMIDVEQFKDSEELKILLGYINTSTDKQVKGVHGGIK